MWARCAIYRHYYHNALALNCYWITNTTIIPCYLYDLRITKSSPHIVNILILFRSYKLYFYRILTFHGLRILRKSILFIIWRNICCQIIITGVVYYVLFISNNIHFLLFLCALNINISVIQTYINNDNIHIIIHYTTYLL